LRLCSGRQNTGKTRQKYTLLNITPRVFLWGLLRSTQPSQSPHYCIFAQHAEAAAALKARNVRQRTSILKAHIEGSHGCHLLLEDPACPLFFFFNCRGTESHLQDTVWLGSAQTPNESQSLILRSQPTRGPLRPPAQTLILMPRQLGAASPASSPEPHLQPCSSYSAYTPLPTILITLQIIKEDPQFKVMASTACSDYLTS
jgi:hypothetical protein